jgi:hypothetical protein
MKWYHKKDWPGANNTLKKNNNRMEELKRKRYTSQAQSVNDEEMEESEDTICDI